MRKKYLKILLVILVVFLISGFLGLQAEAGLGDDIRNNLLDVRIGAGLPTTNNPVDVVSSVIKGALSLLVIIFFILIIIAGFRWMMSGGNEETVGKAKKTIASALIGVAIVIFSYAITTLIFDLVLKNK